MAVDKPTERAQEAIAGSARIAGERGNPVVEPDHLLAALLEAREGVVEPVLAARRRRPARPARRHRGRHRPPPAGERVGHRRPALQPLPRRCCAARAGGRGAQRRVHLHRAPAARPCWRSRARPARRWPPAASTRDGLLGALRTVRGSARVTDPNPEDKYQALEQYGRDLTEAAERGDLDPVIGRDEEIRRVIQVLSRRTKNNPVLIGEPGMGKTAIVEGLAQRIVAGRHPGGPRRQARDRARRRRAARRRQVPRRVRGPAEGRPEGDRGRRRRGHPLHRRAAHHRRRGRGRGGGGRRQPAEADARARRAARRRRDDARRVPQVRREGRGPRAALPAGDGRRAVASRPPSRSCAA